jgi:hypothetical protein
MVGRIGDRLRSAFGERNVFLLTKSEGSALAAGMGSLDVLVLLIGKEKLGLYHPTDDLSALLNDVLDRSLTLIPVLVHDATLPTAEQSPEDLERLAYRNALIIRRDVLDHSLTLTRVLVHGATMPTAEQSPEDLERLAYRNALIIRRDPDFRLDIQRLIRVIRDPATLREPVPHDKWLIAALDRGFVGIVAGILIGPLLIALAFAFLIVLAVSGLTSFDKAWFTFLVFFWAEFALVGAVSLGVRGGIPGGLLGLLVGTVAPFIIFVGAAIPSALISAAINGTFDTPSHKTLHTVIAGISGGLTGLFAGAALAARHAQRSSANRERSSCSPPRILPSSLIGASIGLVICSFVTWQAGLPLSMKGQEYPDNGIVFVMVIGSLSAAICSGIGVVSGVMAEWHSPGPAR